MPNLAQTLPANDIGFLRIIASLWGLELTSSDPAEAAVELAEGLCDAELIDEVVSTLPQDGRSVLLALAAENGRMPWVAFARRFGDVREMGPGKRDREQPHLHPTSAAEILWYRALVAKAFFDGEKGPQEFAFIPDDLFIALDFAGLLAEPEPEPVSDEPPEDSAPPKLSKSVESLPAAKIDEDALGRPASPTEKAFPILSGDQILDDACTFLAALRIGLEPPAMRIPTPILRDFLLASHLISATAPRPEDVKAFLEESREKALATLLAGWQSSESFDELRQLPGLTFEGGWSNQPLVTREFLLNILDPIPDGQWWSLPAFVRDIKTKYPDYQRPAGDYDSWFIKRAADGVFLRGFANWDEVDGALIRYFICGPLYWLGLVDLAAPEEGARLSAFRPRQTMLNTPEDGKLSITSQGKIIVPRLAPRAARYQIARFTECEFSPNVDEYRYRATPQSLKRAAAQGLKVSHLLSLLAKNSGGQVPPIFVKALQRWEVNGTEARVETLTVLKVSKPEVLNELRASKAARFLGEIIGPTTVVLQSGAESKVMGILADMGLLTEVKADDAQDGSLKK